MQKQKVVESFFLAIVVILGVFLALWYVAFVRNQISQPVSQPVSSPNFWCELARQFPQNYDVNTYCKISSPVSTPKKPAYCDICNTSDGQYWSICNSSSCK